MNANKKQDFFSNFADPRIFDCLDVNLLKTAQQGIRRQLDTSIVKRTLLDGPIWYHQLVFFAKYILNGCKPIQRINTGRSSVLFFVTSRLHVNDCGHIYSPYSLRVLNQWPRGAGKPFQIVYGDSDLDGLRTESDLFFFSKVRSVNFSQPIGDYLYLVRSIRATYQVIESNSSFSTAELLSIKVMLDEFVRDFMVWDRYLSGLKKSVNVALFVCPYMSEEVIWALRRRNVLITELQHGVILDESDFYVYPDVVRSIRKRMLFPDRIAVFGEFWRERLLKGCEFDDTQIKVIGDYIFRNISTRGSDKYLEVNRIKKRTILLLTQQVCKPIYFVSYVEFLSNKIIRDNLIDIDVIVKVHPAEHIDFYKFLENDFVTVTQDANTSELMKRADVVISIYSLALFEAISCGAKTYSLSVQEYTNLTDDLVNNGVSQYLGLSEFPEFPQTSRSTDDSFYSTFSVDSLLEIAGVRK